MTTDFATTHPAGNNSSAGLWDNAAFLFFSLFYLFVLFHNLGGPPLLEPDEGRNAEKAREMLLIKDWVTPHEDFLPVLDKPVFFYWLIAFSYKFFGISEWSARLPSALGALGSVVLIYLFVKRFLGFWEALWSALILVTSVEFFILSRVVIFDMALTFFITLSLCCFYWGLNTDTRTKKRPLYLLMYGGMGVATLIKGLVGIILPGMIIVLFLLLARKWSALREMDFPLGAIFFLLMVIPWYTWVEIRNPGYLRYFLWEEHFVRFLTPHFHRSEPWYYFLVVLAVGFIPWTFLLPYVIHTQWKTPSREITLFLVLWTILPFLFFSLSDSKLPHYILPMYPPLAILTGVTVVNILSDFSLKGNRILLLPLYAQMLPISYLVLGTLRPSLLPNNIREPIAKISPLLFASSAVILIAFSVFILANRKSYWKRQNSLYVYYCISLIPLFILIGQIKTAISPTRSAKDLAERSSALIGPKDQIVFYNTFLEGLPFYLGVKRPIWIVWSGAKSEIMGSFYVAEKRPAPAKGYGKILFTFAEFAEEWKKSNQRLLVLVKKKNLPSLDGPLPKELLKVNEFVLLTNQ